MNAINCTGKNMSDGLLYALGDADASMYLCSKEVRPCENPFFSCLRDFSVARKQISYVSAGNNVFVNFRSYLFWWSEKCDQNVGCLYSYQRGSRMGLCV